MQDFCANFLPEVFDILKLSRQKPQAEKMYEKMPFDNHEVF